MDIWVKKYGGLELINLSKISSIENEQNKIVFYVPHSDLKGDWANWTYEDNETGKRLQKKDFSWLAELLQCKLSNRPWDIEND